ncbi:MAG: serine dehydratase subunit alpha family protein [Bacteroidales bacterium]|nr:serine dehydratase subunit alpha family protein [Bacteroidales bacterium]
MTLERELEIIELIKKEVKPALGCTEPIAVALAVASSCETLRNGGYGEPKSLDVEVSANILKNGMGVGIPGTGMVGLHIASALDATCGKSEYKLEVLKDLDDNTLAAAKKMVADGNVKIGLADTPVKLYIKATAINGENRAETIIKDNHDSIISVKLNDKQVDVSGEAKKSDCIIAEDCDCTKKNNAEAGAQAPAEKTTLDYKLTVKEILEFAENASFENIRFILDSVKLNYALAEEGLKNDYGLKVGKTIIASQNQSVFGSSVMTYAMAATAAASDARMAGCLLPAMSNSGSGNQGITVTVPVIAVAKKMNVSDEKLARALVLSHLIAIHIKGYLGKLSALCGCVIASTGSSCGIVYLNGGKYEQICAAIKNMVGNITGMVCDGAKVGCALKVASGVSSSVQSAVLALDNICISSNDGIIEDCIEKTVYNLGTIGSQGMQVTDRMILDIMVSK